MSRAGDIVARSVAGCAWSLIALVGTAITLALYIAPLVALWYLLP